MYNVVELFSGIGSQAKALKNLGYNINLVGSSEWDIHAIIAYDLIHNDAEMPRDIADMNKEELLEILKNYTFSNTGKASLEFSSLRSFSTFIWQSKEITIMWTSMLSKGRIFRIILTFSRILSRARIFLM